MKERIFYCGWNQYDNAHDHSMTSERAARMLRAWREQSKAKRLHLQRVAPHEYRVSTRDYPNMHHLIKWSLTK